MNSAYGRDEMHTKDLVRSLEGKRTRVTDKIKRTVM
jgi:hypothetical protein